MPRTQHLDDELQVEGNKVHQIAHHQELLLRDLDELWRRSEVIDDCHGKGF